MQSKAIAVCSGSPDGSVYDSIPCSSTVDHHATRYAVLRRFVALYIVFNSHRQCKRDTLFCHADGIEEQGSSIMYKANVRRILTEGKGDQLKAVGVQLLDGRIFKGQVHLCCDLLSLDSLDHGRLNAHSNASHVLLS